MQKIEGDSLCSRFVLPYFEIKDKGKLCGF